MLALLPGVLYVDQELPLAPPEYIGDQTTAVITGRVTEEGTGSPIIDLQALAYDGVTAVFLGEANAVNGPAEVNNGFYTVTVNSLFNKVKLNFIDQGLPPHVEEWYNDKSSFSTADDIDTTAGGTITNINAQLTLANAALTGTVKFDGTNAPVGGAAIDLLEASTGQFVGTGITDLNGLFTLTSLPPDIYKVRASGSNIAGEHYQDQPPTLAGLAAATLVTLTNGTTQSIDILVDQTAVITGMLTDTVTSQPITSAFLIRLFDTDGNFISLTGTNGNGVYEFRGFGSGAYKISYDIFGYHPELYDNIPTGFFQFLDQVPANFDAATVISATSGQTVTNINAGLDPLTLISGTVTSLTGTTMSNVDVSLFDEEDELIDVTTTDVSGKYAFFGLQGGSYKVLVGQSGSLPDNDIIPHAVEWFNNASVISSATIISLTNGVPQTDKNVQLAGGGCLAGQIVDFETNLPVPDAFYQVLQQENNNQVIAVIPNGGNFWTDTPSSSSGSPTLESGEFLACGLPAGNFTVNCDGFGRDGERIEATVTPGSVTGGLVCRVGGQPPTLYLPILLKQ
jgi:hypothetical protein